MPRALVTGGSGYFGSLLTRKLRERGYAVRIFDLHAPADDGVEFAPGDIRDLAAISSSCRGIDVAFHNVAQVPLAKDKRLFWSVNRDGTRNLLEACVTQKVGKVVYTSSSAVYGIPRRNPITETTEPHPMEEYGKAKLAGENLCREYAARGLNVAIMRPRTIMGHGRLGIFQSRFEWIRQGHNIPVLNGGRNVYQFVHADDLAEACILAGQTKGSEDYNCGAENFGSMREVLEDLCHHAATGSRVKSLPMWLMVPAMNVSSRLGLSPLAAYHSLMYGRSMYFDISKAKRDLGWQPRYSNQEMFLESYQWYLKHRAEVSTSGGSHHQSAVKQGALKLLHWFL